MKMEFVFDDEGLEKEGVSEEWCLQKIRQFFSSYENSSIVETSEGVFEGSTENYTAFGSAIWFYKATWFMNVIKEWYWTMEADFQYEREDILENLKQKGLIDDAFDETTACGPDHLNPDKVSLEEFAASIQRGHDDIAAGRYYTLDEAFKRLKEKYSV